MSLPKSDESTLFSDCRRSGRGNQTFETLSSLPVGAEKWGAGTAARPLMSSSLVELTSMVDDPGSSAERLAEVADELRCRKSGGARKLLARLEGGGPKETPRGSGERPGRKRRTGRVVGSSDSGDDGPTAIPTETPDTTEQSRDIMDQLEVLRTTFTLESEILARWGITGALPCDMRRSVLQQWDRIVSDEPDHLGRSRARLAADIESLGHIAAPERVMIDDV